MKNLQSLKDGAKIKRLLYIDQFLLLIKEDVKLTF